MYSNRAFLDKNSDPARKLVWYGGYLEGWALYVEFISYDYAADLLEQCGQSDAAQSARLEKHTRSLQVVHVHSVGSPDPRRGCRIRSGGRGSWEIR